MEHLASFSLSLLLLVDLKQVHLELLELLELQELQPLEEEVLNQEKEVVGDYFLKKVVEEGYFPMKEVEVKLNLVKEVVVILNHSKKGEVAK